MISRRAVVSSAVALPAILRAQRRKPNFLFLIADDHAGYVLGCDGNPLARTPNIDVLASQGVRFSQHYCNSPVCTPSRQSLFTGQLPHAAGVTRLPTPLAQDKPTLAKQFLKAGYKTAVFGKMHFIRRGVPGMHGLEIACTEDVLTREWQQQVKPRPIPPEIRTKPPWKPLKDPARVWLNADKLPYPRYDADMRASFQVRLVDNFLETHRDKPFAKIVHQPHLEAGAHIGVIARVRQLVGVQPDARRIFERFPRRFGSDLGRYRTGLHLLLPLSREHVFSARDFQPVHSWHATPDEVHLAEHRGLVTRFEKLFREGWLILGQRRWESCHAGSMRELSRKEALARRSAHRRVTVMLRKPNALACENINIRRTRQGISIAAEHVASVIVGNQEQKVRLPALCA